MTDNIRECLLLVIIDIQIGTPLDWDIFGRSGESLLTFRDIQIGTDWDISGTGGELDFEPANVRGSGGKDQLLV